MRLTTQFLITLLACTSFNLSAAERETETFTYELDEGGRISLDNVNGDVSVTGGPGDTVTITAEKRADNQEDLDKLRIKIKADSSAIRIETVHEKSESRWFGSNNSGQVTYTLTVPSSANIDTISTINGDVDVEGVSGTVNAESINGDLDLKRLMGDANLETTNGQIKAGFARMGGSQRVSADTVNGQITIVLPDNASARLSAEVLNGGIDADDFGLEVEKGGFVGKDLNGTIGGGEARIDLDTVNGGIRVKKSS
jgi:DUF4097 and DUF4098 domain-containing protein YvlB